ncbi:hypothetical protein TRIUR3_20455 [Triticum urartu]|uniref:MPN domain-containing protein n=1 Tax=Triticum urartu TaxID=4572 RepID=M8A8C9_TRIUA|nr:hypothetical protein TRIUR3_20455 [Triticum urartu]
MGAVGKLALTLVEDHFQAQGLAVVGYYHANARRDDADLPAVAKRVGDHIFRYFPRAAVLLLDNVKLEEVVKGNSRDAVVQEPDATVDDDPYYTEGAYYYVQAADDQE